MKKIIALILALLMMFALVSCGGQQTTNRTDIPPKGKFVVGLTVSADGTLMLDGKPIQAFGVNIYDVFPNKRRVNSDFNVEAAFKGLQEAGISVARISVGPYTADAFAEYYYSPNEYYEALDAVIAAAEKYHIGLFASLCWNNVIPEFVGGYWEDIADPNSKTVKTAIQYYTDIVRRYKDSPAIWAWEFGNEYNLAADLCFVNLSTNYITSENISKYYAAVSAEMRKIDPYRLIVGGDSELSCRPAALWKTHSWTPDTVDDIEDSTALYAPSPMEAVSSHMYQYGTSGKTLEDTDFKNFNESISMALEACHRLNKGYYIGEYGPGDFFNNGSGTHETNKHVIDLIHQACLDNNVQIALGWICVSDFTGEESIRDEDYKYWFSEIKRLNTELKAAGKQDNIASYWEKASASQGIYTGDDAIFHKITNHMRSGGNPGVAMKITNSKNASGGWQVSNYDTNSTITLEDAALADGSTGKVFHVVNTDDQAKALLKYTVITGLSNTGHYKLSFWMKSSGMTGEGISFKLTAPAFGETSGVKCDKDGEWQHMEFDIGSPTQGKSQNSLAFYFNDQAGDIMIYGIEITDM